MLIGDFLMNVLPLLLLGLLLGGDRFSSIKELLMHIDFASFAPVFQLLGVDQKTVDFLCSEEFADSLSQSGDIKTLLPYFTSLFSKPSPTEKEPEQKLKPCDYLSPIKNVAPTDVGATIEKFLS